MVSVPSIRAVQPSPWTRDAADVVPPPALEQEPVGTGLERVLAPSLDPALLDLEQVGEVRPHRDRDACTPRARRRGCAARCPPASRPRRSDGAAPGACCPRVRRGVAPGPTKVVANGSASIVARGSGGWPSTSSCHRDSSRVSWKNRPCGSSGAMSPVRPQTQKPAPSTRVTVPPGEPRGRGLTGEGPADRHAVSRSRWRTCTGGGRCGGARCSDHGGRSPLAGPPERHLQPGTAPAWLPACGVFSVTGVWHSVEARRETSRSGPVTG